LISLSPLSAAHPSCFQPTLVRPSNRCYPAFSLATDRSSRFASNPCNSIALFRLAFATAPVLDTLTLLQRFTSRLIMQKARGQAGIAPVVTLPLLVSTRFQVLLTPRTGVLFTFPSRYWFTIGRAGVFSLRRWSSQIPTRLLVPRGTRVPIPASCPGFRVRGSHALWLARSQGPSASCSFCMLAEGTAVPSRSVPRPPMDNAGRLGIHQV
jgi:hypothetical protein